MFGKLWEFLFILNYICIFYEIFFFKQDIDMEDVEDIDLVKYCMIKGVKKEIMDVFLQIINNSIYWVCDIISAYRYFSLSRKKYIYVVLNNIIIIIFVIIGCYQ